MRQTLLFSSISSSSSQAEKSSNVTTLEQDWLGFSRLVVGSKSTATVAMHMTTSLASNTPRATSKIGTGRERKCCQLLSTIARLQLEIEEKEGFTGFQDLFACVYTCVSDNYTYCPQWTPMSWLGLYRISGYGISTNMYLGGPYRLQVFSYECRITS